MEHYLKSQSPVPPCLRHSTWEKVLRFIAGSDVPSPYLLLDGDVIREKVSSIGKNIRNSRVFYAVKANPDREVLGFIAGSGVSFEIASEGELRILAALGVPSERIISSNPIKSFRFLEEAVSYGVRLFAFDSESEVDKMAVHAAGTEVYVRLTVPNEGSEWPLSKKFGVEIDEAVRLLAYAAEKGLIPAGLTFHVGSQCTNVYNWDTALDKARQVWEKSADLGVPLRVLNIGGGYPIRYTRDVVGIGEIERKVNDSICGKFPAETQVHIEPGRAVVGDAGIFVAKVIGKARRGSENWLYLDVGVFNGLMESVGGIRYQYYVDSRNMPMLWTIAGPSCDSFDVIDREVELCEPLVGDTVLILSSGAYTVSYASEFNGFSIPKTVLV